MKTLTSAAVGFVLYAIGTVAQGVSTYVNPAVPTGTPIPGNYTGGLRPQVHFSPPQHFMNDPNGMFRDANGTWHIYYQYNPTADVAGDQHWGHATSEDLWTWINQPIALFPPEEMVYVFSGSAVTDPNNTSGFFPNQTNGVVAIFTLARYFPTEAGPQTQNIAYSHDGGYTFQLYNGNPVINSTSSQFRDPKVIWYQDHWVMVVAYAQEFTVGFFTSPDLKNWTFASNFSHHGLLGTQYECPNLVPIPSRDYDTGEPGENMYLLAISIQPGAPLGGSITEYFPGYFNGTHFETVDGAARLTDFAKDNYAAQFFYGIPEGEPAVDMGWASNWQYAQRVPSGSEGWRSAFTVGRQHYLTNATRIGWTLATEPYNVEPILDTPLNQSSWEGNGTATVDYSSVASNALYFEANVTGINGTALGPNPTMNFTFLSPVSGESVRTGFYFGGDNPFFLDRSLTNGFKNDVFWTDKFSVADVYNGTYWSVKGIIDRTILEVYIDRGIHTGTMLFWPDQPLTIMQITSADLPAGTNVSIAVWGLKSTWSPQANEHGTVLGNVTMQGGGYGNSTAKRHLVYDAQFQV